MSSNLRLLILLSSRNCYVISISLSVQMVSKALDMSIPTEYIVTSCSCIFTRIHLYAHTISAVLLPILYALWLLDRQVFTLGWIRFSRILEKCFLLISTIIGVKLFTAPCGLLGFGSKNSIPVPKSLGSYSILKMCYSLSLKFVDKQCWEHF